jgi:hypothetical protein
MAETKDKEIIEVSKSELTKILDGQKALQEEIKILREAANKSNLEFAESKLPKKATLPTVKLCFAPNDKGVLLAVVAWTDMPKNDVYQEPRSGNFVENQSMRLILEDDSIVNMEYADFNRLERRTATVASITKSGDKSTYNLVCDGKEYCVGVEFVNA